MTQITDIFETLMVVLVLILGIFGITSASPVPSVICPTAPCLALLTPNDGGMVQQGGIISIQWISRGVPGDAGIGINLKPKGKESAHTVVGAVATNFRGAHQLYISEKIPPGEYFILIFATREAGFSSAEKPSDLSDKTILVVEKTKYRKDL